MCVRSVASVAKSFDIVQLSSHATNVAVGYARIMLRSLPIMDGGMVLDCVHVAGLPIALGGYDNSDGIQAADVVLKNVLLLQKAVKPILKIASKTG